MTQFDVNHFIEKFEAIPEELWCTNHYHEGEKRCALGHCEYVGGEGDALSALFTSRTHDRTGVATVNDGLDDHYKQETPKQRILAALRDIKEKSV